MRAPGVRVRPGLVLVTVGIGAFMSTLDGSVVNVSLPEIRRVLDADIAAAEWVVVVYLLVMSALLLTFGRLGDLLGHRRVYLAGFVLFGGASFLCGAATSMPMLVAARGLQAVGAAALQSVAAALLTRVHPPERRGRALGLMSLFTYAGLTAGPSVGGFITTHLGWRWIFLVNLPVAALTLALGWRSLPREPGAAGVRFDLAGAATWGAGLAILLLGLDRGTRHSFASAPVVGLLAAAAVLLALFVRQEQRHPAPMVDPALLRIRPFAGGLVAAFLNYIAVFSIMFLSPFHLVEDVGLLPSQAGLLLTAMPATMAVAAPLAGGLSDRIGARLPATLGMGVLALGLLLLRTADTQAAFVLALAVCGLGTGIFVSPNTSAVMGAAPRARQGVASGMIATARTSGMVVGVAVAGSLFAAALGSRDRPDAFALALWPAVAASVAAAFASLFRGRAPPGVEPGAQPHEPR